MSHPKSFLLLLSLLLVSVSCAPISSPATSGESAAATETTTLTVFAAASLTEAFDEIGQNFTAANPGIEVVFNFAGSQQLAQQIGEGAPADVFAAANATQMNVAIEAGRIVTGTARTFVHNRLVVITPADNPAQIATLQDLTRPGLKLVFAAQAVPVGQYSIDFLDKAAAGGSLGANYKDAVIANVVSYEENVRAVLAKVILGEADAGIVYTSDVTLDAADQVQRIDIPDALNTIAAYPIGVVSDSANPELAQQFMDYVLAPEGQTVLAHYGFISTTGDASGAAPGGAPVEITAQVGLQPEAQSVAFTGGDGYSQEVTLAEINADPNAMIVIDEGDALRNIIPTLMPRYWVKGLISIEVK